MANGSVGKGKDAWTFVARRGSDSRHVLVSRAKAEEIASSPAGSRTDFLALWLVPPFYRREAQWRAKHGGLPLAWEYNLGKQELPEDFLRDPRAWLERVKREEYPTYEETKVPGTRGWNPANQAGRTGVTRKTIAQEILPVLRRYRYEDQSVRAVIEDVERGEAPQTGDVLTARRALMNLRESGHSSFTSPRGGYDLYSQQELDELLAVALDLERIAGSRPVKTRPARESR